MVEGIKIVPYIILQKSQLLLVCFDHHPYHRLDALEENLKKFKAKLLKNLCLKQSSLMHIISLNIPLTNTESSGRSSSRKMP